MCVDNAKLVLSYDQARQLVQQAKHYIAMPTLTTPYACAVNAELVLNCNQRVQIAPKFSLILTNVCG